MERPRRGEGEEKKGKLRTENQYQTSDVLRVGGSDSELIMEVSPLHGVTRRCCCMLAAAAAAPDSIMWSAFGGVCLQLRVHNAQQFLHDLRAAKSKAVPIPFLVEYLHVC
jgi:hypothetical protein